MKKFKYLTLAISSIALIGCGGNDTKPPEAPPTPTFSSFNNVAPNQSLLLGAITDDTEATLSFGQVVSGIFNRDIDANAEVTITISNLGTIEEIALKDVNRELSFDATGVGFPLDSGAGASLYGIDHDIWEHDYQTFGYWVTEYTGIGAETIEIGVISAGLKTPFASIPTSNTALFEGYYVGVLSDAGTPFEVIGYADLSVNFSSKLVTLDGWGASIYDVDTFEEVIDTTLTDSLELLGTLRYTNSNAYSGDIQNLDGLMTGEATGAFYGPNAEETGGVLRLSNDRIMLTASFGAKR